jgi:putative ATP-grasp target RiPP
MSSNTRVPWGFNRVTDRLPPAPSMYSSPVLDPATQTALYFDESGQPIEAGTHGTNKGQGTTTKSGGNPDGGGKPGTQVADDNNVDYVSD